MRIVSLLPSVTEICSALGLADEVAAVTHECDYPLAAREKPHATRSILPPDVTDSATIDSLIRQRVLEGKPIYELDIGLLEQIEPDLIFTQQLCEICAVSYEDVLAAARLLPKTPKVVSIQPTTLDEVLESLHQIGNAAGRAKTSEAIVRALRARVQYINEHVDHVAIPRRVVCLEWLDPPMVAGHWVPQMVEIAGGRDVLGHHGKPSYQVEWQQVVEAAPDVLILMPCGLNLSRTAAEASKLAMVPQLAEIPAVQHEQVYAVDSSGYFNRPGPRLVGGIEILAGIFHPEAFARIGPPGTIQGVHFRSMVQVS
jgi:iron complex transport system substrate-binding protein